MASSVEGRVSRVSRDVGGRGGSKQSKLTLFFLRKPLGRFRPVGHDKVTDDTHTGGDNTLNKKNQPPAVH